MTKAMEIYKAMECVLGEEKKLTGGMSKREYMDVQPGGKVTYTFYFYNGELKKFEGFNGHDFIEIYNK